VKPDGKIIMFVGDVLDKHGAEEMGKGFGRGITDKFIEGLR
jgi:hypothetical protein